MRLTEILGDGFDRELLSLPQTGDGLFVAGQNGVSGVWAPRDRKAEFAAVGDRMLCRVGALSGRPAYYPLHPAAIERPVQAVLMDLDGTSVHSEWFWMWIIERTVAALIGRDEFRLAPEDEPFVSGHSVTEHLRYCIDKYAPGHSVEQARETYFAVTRHEMSEIMAGRGKEGAFTPAPHLKEFLLALKGAGLKIGLVTSGLTEKAMPEIVSAFSTLGMGDPRDFYDAIISAGTALGPGAVGTMGELEAKPHPWLYAETAIVGLGLDPEKGRAVVLEDSSAGVVAARLAGYPCIGMEGGNIRQSGVSCLCTAMCADLTDALPLILG